MNKKNFFIYILTTIVFSVFFWYSIVFWIWNLFWPEIKTSFKLSNNIYPDSLTLKDNKVAFTSNIDISNYNLISSCNMHSNFVSKQDNIYYFSLRYFDNKCNDNFVFLKDEKNNNVATIKFNIVSEYQLYSNLIDYNTKKLNIVYNGLQKKKKSLLKYNGKYNKNLWISYYNYLIHNRTLNEVLYNTNIIKSILNLRNKKYLTPIDWTKVPERYTKLPNSWRWYRWDYTDWVHHWWDFDWEFWEQVIAIDDWLIVRVISDFDFEDLNKVKKWANLSDFDKNRNLDILRWNQVWLKTSKWDVAFYSHLNDIYSNIKVWEIVRKWQAIWTIWITWIPDKNYNDYHVHLPIHKNPYKINMVWKYDYDDYMAWAWYFKWETLAETLKKQNNVFE